VIRLALPSFSGATPDVPGLLKYACALTTNVLPAPVARVEFPGRAAAASSKEAEEQERGRGGAAEGRGEMMDLVLRGKPLVALCFNDMEMRVEEPEALPQQAQPQKQEQRQEQQGQGRRGLLWGRRQRERATVA
jgi:hypothetical protein